MGGHNLPVGSYKLMSKKCLIVMFDRLFWLSHVVRCVYFASSFVAMYDIQYTTQFKDNSWQNTPDEWTLQTHQFENDNVTFSNINESILKE